MVDLLDFFKWILPNTDAYRVSLKRAQLFTLVEDTTPDAGE